MSLATILATLSATDSLTVIIDRVAGADWDRKSYQIVVGLGTDAERAIKGLSKRTANAVKAAHSDVTRAHYAALTAAYNVEARALGMRTW